MYKVELSKEGVPQRPAVSGGKARSALGPRLLRWLSIGALIGLGSGLSVGLSAGLSNAGPSVGLSVGLSYWLLLGLSQGVSGATIEDKQRVVPNQGIRRSALNGLVFGLISTVIVGIIIGVSTGLEVGLFFELSYANVVAGVNLKPRVFFSHDVHGYSADGVFSQGRWSLAPGIRADYNNKAYVDLSYNRFNHGAKYDFQHDRDFYSLVVGINF